MSLAEIQSLLRDPTSGLWKSLDLENRLKVRLRHSYKVYMHTVSSIHNSIQGMMRMMKLDRNGQVSNRLARVVQPTNSS